MPDVVITPASGKVEFNQTVGGTVAASIQLTGGNVLQIGGTADISYGDSTRDIYIGDGTNSVDIIFEQNGAIRPASATSTTAYPMASTPSP